MPGVGQGRICRAGLPNQCCKLAPRPPLAGDFPSFPANGSQSPAPKVKPGSAKKGRGERGRCRAEPRRVGGSCAAAAGGGGRREEEEELRSPGPGASPLTALGSDAFPESRRERNKVWGSPPPLLLSHPPAPLLIAAPRPFAGAPHRSRASLRR